MRHLFPYILPQFNLTNVNKIFLSTNSLTKLKKNSDLSKYIFKFLYHIIVKNFRPIIASIYLNSCIPRNNQTKNNKYVNMIEKIK